MYIPSSNTTCSLPQLPEARQHHTQDGKLACGGPLNSKTLTTCDKWSAGTWTRTSHKLARQRYGHVSWSTPSGMFLIGGEHSVSRQTSELLREDGSVEEGFALKYSTRYNIITITITSPKSNPRPFSKYLSSQLGWGYLSSNMTLSKRTSLNQFSLNSKAYYQVLVAFVFTFTLCGTGMPALLLTQKMRR